jgi:transketolase
VCKKQILVIPNADGYGRCCGNFMDGILKHNPDDPKWIARDRFVLSAGTGSMLIYSMLHLSGYDVSMDDFKIFPSMGKQNRRTS